MDQQFEAPHPNGAVKVNEPPKRRWFRREVMIGLLIAVALLWGYAIWYSVTRGSPEDLDKDARATVADACADARTQLVDLPDLPTDATATADVTLVQQENAVLTEMVDRIDAVTTSGTDASKALDGWVADWRNLIAARTTFANDLAADGNARLRIPSVKQGSIEPITDRMDTYATGRGLDGCRPAALQAEVVDQPRDYTHVEDA